MKAVHPTNLDLTEEKQAGCGCKQPEAVSTLMSFSAAYMCWSKGKS